MRMRVAWWSPILGLALAACASASQTPTAATVSEDAMTCDASKAQWALGQIPDDALIERARGDAGARVVRIIEYGMLVTMEYNEARLTIDLDQQGRVRQVRCG